MGGANDMGDSGLPSDPEAMKRLVEGLDPSKREMLTEPPRQLTPDEERTAAEMLNEDGTMTRAAGLVFVQHLMIEFLHGKAAEFRSAVENVQIDAVGRADAMLFAELADHLADSLVAANEATLALQHAEKARVQVVRPGGEGKVIRIPGSRLPGGAP